jgi:HSP20 family protein
MTGTDPTTWMWTEACAMIERAERLQRQFFRPGRFAMPSANWEPPVDIFESDREIRIIAALPGVEPGDLEVYLDADELIIAGLRQPPALAGDATIHRLEIPYGRFERRIALPAARVELQRSELVRGCLSLGLTKQF